jgi:hypothetical protein
MVRTVRATEWDTVLTVGVTNPDDTTLLSPRRLRLGPDHIFVLDDINQNLRALDRTSGRLLWSYADRGQGPNQIGNVADVQVVADRMVWLFDTANRKFLVFADDGELLASHSLRGVETSPSRFVIVGDSVLLFSNYPETGLSVAILDSMAIRISGRLPWPADLTIDQNIGVSIAVSRTPGEIAWVAAFDHGPGFLVGRRDRIEAYEYIDPSPFPLKSGPSVRAAGADSARFTGLASSLVHDSLYLLFGGRPRRQAHPPEETRWIDCYDSRDGSYLYSYYLPSDTWSMDTLDGRTFYVLTENDGLPVLTGLVAKIHQE